MQPGEVIEAHAHNFDHVTTCRTGSLLIEALTADGLVYAEKMLYAASDEHPDEFYAVIKAGVRHRLTAKSPNTRYDCMYAHRNAQGDVVQQATGWDKSYA